MQKTFTPKICTGEAPEYAGTVTLRLPTYDQRMGLYEATGVDEVENLKTVSLVRALARHLPEYLVSIDITRLSDQHKFDSWESLQYDHDMASVISECCLTLISKVKAGNSQAPG